MRKSILTLATMTCLMTANTAFAQEAEKTPAQSFAGPRIEATIGLDKSSDDRFLDNGVTGMRAGGAIGYDIAIGKRVTLGVEGGIGWMVAGNAEVGPFPPTVPDNYKYSAGRDIDVSGRLGYALSPKTLIYGKAGWASQSHHVETSSGQSYNWKSDGLRLGAGLEQKLTSNIYAKAEYRYTRYEDNGIDKKDRHQLLTGIGVRF
jgi:outer membrane immunogenic protein